MELGSASCVYVRPWGEGEAAAGVSRGPPDLLACPSAGKGSVCWGGLVFVWLAKGRAGGWVKPSLQPFVGKGAAWTPPPPGDVLVGGGGA